jgi:hypothetical protein
LGAMLRRVALHEREPTFSSSLAGMPILIRREPKPIRRLARADAAKAERAISE